jgi:hypothetical protein
VRRMSFWPRGAAKPAGENFLSAIIQLVHRRLRRACPEGGQGAAR